MSGGARLRVLGIDPGTAVTGWGVVERSGGAKRGGSLFAHVAHGTIRLRAGTPLPAKLAAIHAALVACCAAWMPTVVALEKSFVGRNVQSAFRLGEVRGVALLIAESAGCDVAEYSPAAVKMAITGNGRAEKSQVQRMITREFALTTELPADAADALAVALCHLQAAGLRQVLAAHPTTALRRAPAARKPVTRKQVTQEQITRERIN